MRIRSELRRGFSPARVALAAWLGSEGAKRLVDERIVRSIDPHDPEVQGETVRIRRLAMAVRHELTPRLVSLVWAALCLERAHLHFADHSRLRAPILAAYLDLSGTSMQTIVNWVRGKESAGDVLHTQGQIARRRGDLERIRYWFLRLLSPEADLALTRAITSPVPLALAAQALCGGSPIDVADQSARVFTVLSGTQAGRDETRAQERLLAGLLVSTWCDRPRLEGALQLLGDDRGAWRRPEEAAA